MDSFPLFPRMLRLVRFVARDSLGRPLSTKSAVVTMSNSALAVIGLDTLPAQILSGQTVDELQGVITFLDSGTETMRVTLGGVAQDFLLTVRPLPPVSTALAIDSFTIIESRPCAACGIAYDPILRLRAPSGGTAVDVIALSVTPPQTSSQFCSGTFTYAPGQTADLIYYPSDPYDYRAPFETEVDGDPLPDGPATAQVIVRDAHGDFGLVQATGTIQRMVQSPALPRTGDSSLLDWSCY
jgi:hypothetical protein